MKSSALDKEERDEGRGRWKGCLLVSFSASEIEAEKVPFAHTKRRA